MSTGPKPIVLNSNGKVESSTKHGDDSVRRMDTEGPSNTTPSNNPPLQEPLPKGLGPDRTKILEKARAAKRHYKEQRQKTTTEKTTEDAVATPTIQNNMDDVSPSGSSRVHRNVYRHTDDDRDNDDSDSDSDSLDYQTPLPPKKRRRLTQTTAPPKYKNPIYPSVFTTFSDTVRTEASNIGRMALGTAVASFLFVGLQAILPSKKQEEIKSFSQNDFMK